MGKMSEEQRVAMAEALAQAGIVSDEPETLHPPRWSANRAFAACNPGSKKSEWDSWQERLKSPSVPAVAYYREMAQICHRALRRHDLQEDLQEPIAHARGYYSAYREMAERDPTFKDKVN